MAKAKIRISGAMQSVALFGLMRPKQWIKNGFVLAPLIFSGVFLNLDALNHALVALLLFCIASSATYIVNDIHDIERDRCHPIKSKTRALAAGTISIPSALILLGCLCALLLSGWLFVPKVVMVIVAYLVMNLAYTFILKHQPVVDIFTIAIGFVLRVYAGAMAIDVPVSSWMFITTLCLALYLAAIKRRQELCQSGVEGRKVLEKYSLSLVDRYAEMSATGALLFYSMFVMSSKPELVITIPLVLFGLFRYWFMVEALDGGESPTDALLADWQLLLTLLLWVAACGLALWPTRVNMEWSYIITPFMAWLVAGVLKFVINSIKVRQLAFGLIGYGGLPSNHSSIVSSMATLIALKAGVEDSSFGVAITLAFIVIIDAATLRRQVGKHALTINKLAANDSNHQILRERMGHSYIEIAAGILVGMIVATAVNIILV